MLCPVVLHRLAAVAHLDDTDGGRRALEEVTKRRELFEVLLRTGLVDEHVQGIVHLLKRRLGLLEVVVYQALAEIAIVFLVHLQQLIEDFHINHVWRK